MSRDGLGDLAHLGKTQIPSVKAGHWTFQCETFVAKIQWAHCQQVHSDKTYPTSCEKMSGDMKKDGVPIWGFAEAKHNVWFSGGCPKMAGFFHPCSVLGWACAVVGLCQPRTGILKNDRNNKCCILMQPFFFLTQVFFCLVSFWLLDIFTSLFGRSFLTKATLRFEIRFSCFFLFDFLGFHDTSSVYSFWILFVRCFCFTCRALVLQPSWTTREEIDLDLPADLGGGWGWKAVKEGDWN